MSSNKEKVVEVVVLMCSPANAPAILSLVSRQNNIGRQLRTYVVVRASRWPDMLSKVLGSCSLDKWGVGVPRVTTNRTRSVRVKVGEVKVGDGRKSRNSPLYSPYTLMSRASSISNGLETHTFGRIVGRSRPWTQSALLASSLNSRFRAECCSSFLWLWVATRE